MARNSKLSQPLPGKPDPVAQASKESLSQIWARVPKHNEPGAAFQNIELKTPTTISAVVGSFLLIRIRIRIIIMPIIRMRNASLNKCRSDRGLQWGSYPVKARTQI